MRVSIGMPVGFNLVTIVGFSAMSAGVAPQLASASFKTRSMDEFRSRELPRRGVLLPGCRGDCLVEVSPEAVYWAVAAGLVGSAWVPRIYDQKIFITFSSDFGLCWSDKTDLVELYAIRWTSFPICNISSMFLVDSIYYLALIFGSEKTETRH